jgi:hypothetical protein
MDTSRRPWTSQGRRSERGDKKRDRKDDFDDFLEKKMRELMDFKDDNDRLRAERKRDRQDNDRLRSEIHKKDAEISKKDAELAHLEQQWQEASELQTKRAKAALEKLVEVLVAPSKNEDGDSIDPSSDQGDGACGEDPLRPTLPEETPANTAEKGPGEAAPGPEEEEEAKMQDEALEQAVHSTRSEITEMPQTLGGQ